MTSVTVTKLDHKTFVLTLALPQSTVETRMSRKELQTLRGEIAKLIGE
jgi:hypothetical protein